MAPASAVVIFCHGSGDTGPGVHAWLQQLDGGRLISRLEAANIALDTPSARPIPYGLAGGAVSSVWFDRPIGLEPSCPEHAPSVKASVQQLEDRVASWRRQGVTKIAIGGFSMGGGVRPVGWRGRDGRGQIGLQAGLRLSGLDAVFGMSCYLPEDSAAWESAGQESPPVWMAHGAEDDFIRFEWGQSTASRLAGAGVSVQFNPVPGAHHEMIDGEIRALTDWLVERLS